FQSLKLLSVFAAIRLDGDTDTIEDTLALRLLGPYKGTLKTSHDPLVSKTWKERIPSLKLSLPRSQLSYLIHTPMEAGLKLVLCVVAKHRE
ncbi:hypothetical protein Tco_0049716, partial [Tanacetum coccineum]